jgi:hypothetical protein
MKSSTRNPLRLDCVWLGERFHACPGRLRINFLASAAVTPLDFDFDVCGCPCR